MEAESGGPLKACRPDCVAGLLSSGFTEGPLCCQPLAAALTNAHTHMPHTHKTVAILYNTEQMAKFPK